MPALTRKEFSCLYFPYADIEPSSAVLMAALLFDRIYFLEKNFFRSPDTYGIVPSVLSEVRNLRCFYEVGPDLLGISKRIHPGRPITDAVVLKEIQASIAADLANKELQDLSRDSGKISWYLPNGQYLFWSGLGLAFDYAKAEQQSAAPLIEIFSSRKEDYSPFLESIGYRFNVESFDEVRIRDPIGELMVRLPFLFAESLMVNIALHASRELDLVPFTDSVLHHEFLRTKVRSATTRIKSELSTSKLDLAYPVLGTETLKLGLPKIENLTPARVLELREKCGDQLARFRQEMLILASGIEEDALDRDFQREIQLTVDRRVRPAIQDLGDRLRDLRTDLGLVLIEKGTKAAPLPLVLSVFSGFPIEYLLPASLGLVWLKETLSYLANRSKLKRNGLSLLMDLV